MAGVSLIAIGALITLLRSTIGDIDKDPSLVTLTNKSALKVVQIINTNKNLNSSNCWNQKNPYVPCNDSNKIEPGTYILRGGNDAFWLEGPQTNLFNKDIFALQDDYVRNELGGFLLKGQHYFQKIIISYPKSQEKMNIIIETQNADKQEFSQSLTLKK